MEAEIWQTLPEELLFKILAKLPMRALRRMRAVCKQWNNLFSSRDALQKIVPNQSLHSIPGFFIQLIYEFSNDYETWVIEGCGPEMYKVPLPNNCFVLVACKGIFCCRSRGNRLDLYICNPGTRTGKPLPRDPMIPEFLFSGMNFDSSTGRCTLILGYNDIAKRRREGEGEGENTRTVMSIYDSESNAWTRVSTTVPANIYPNGKGIYSKGKFYWASNSWAIDLGIDGHTPKRNCIVAFTVAEKLWTEIPLPEGCKVIFDENLGGCDGRVMLFYRNADSFCMWKLNEGRIYEWRELPAIRLTINTFPFAAVNSSGLIIMIDREMNLSLLNEEGILIARKMRLPWFRPPLVRPVKVLGSAFEANNVWWP